MKKIIYSVIIIFLLANISYGQLKDQNSFDIRKELLNPLNNSIQGLGFLDMSKLNMDHSFSMSVFSAGGGSLSQALYLNTMSYQISDPLSVAVQWGIRNVPHNSFGNNQIFQNGLFFSGAQIEYKPSDNFHMKFEVSRQPYQYYSRYRPWYDTFRNED